MKLLVTSSGRRTKLLEYIVKEFNLVGGEVIACDCDILAPTLYIANNFYIVPRVDADNYIKEIINICKKEKIDGLLSLIDPELNLLSKHFKDFDKANVKLFACNYDTNEICFDKYKMYEFLIKNGFNAANTYISIDEFKNDIDHDKISFPVFVKPRCGSASLGINKVYNIKHVELLFELDNNLIIQEFLDGQEYGVDCYIDYISKEIINIFMKKKIKMRAGETDKSESFKDDNLFGIINNFVNKLGCNATIDIDAFYVDDRWYISEVNPRFGGGFPHAYECGCNFPRFIINNINGIINKQNIGDYKAGVIMIKHDTLTILNQ